MDQEVRCEYMIKQVHDAVGKRLNNGLRESGLTHVQLGVLIQLLHAEGECLRLKELEKIMRVSQPTVVGIVDRLEDKGFITTLRDPNDRRVRLAKLTDAGREKCDKQHNVLLTAEKEMLSGISPEEEETLRRLLRQMLENLREH